MSFEMIKAWVSRYIQPVSRGEFNQTIKDKVKLTNLIPSGTRDDFTNTSLYGIVSKTPKKVFGFFLNLMGDHNAPLIFAHLDKVKPVPQKDGEIIWYCRKSDGTTFPVKMTFDPDGILNIETDVSVNIISKNVTINCENATVTATTKAKIASDDVEVGNGALEKTVNGETYLPFYNQHIHLDFLGLPTNQPVTPMVIADHLSTKVKAAK